MRNLMLTMCLVATLAATGPLAADDEEAATVTLFAAGSLASALSEVAEAFEAETGISVVTEFAPSGLLRERIEGGASADVFASANMAHPQRLADAGRGGPVALFARNELCGLAQAELAVSRDNLLDVMRDPAVRLGTSTPEADPSGDYAFALFRRADDVQAGSDQLLADKALTLTGGPDSPTAPDGRNLYAWVMTEDRADLFLTYCTNVLLAREDTPSLQRVEVPAELAVGADYGLSLLSANNPDAARLAMFILSPDGQAILDHHGFSAPARLRE